MLEHPIGAESLYEIGFRNRFQKAFIPLLSPCQAVACYFYSVQSVIRSFPYEAALRKRFNTLRVSRQTPIYTKSNLSRAETCGYQSSTSQLEDVMGHTMREVAKRAGVSPATVSPVLNKTPYIAAKTEQRVLEVVQQLNYIKNVHARRLATGRSDLFGLLISEIVNPYFPEIIRGFQAAAWGRPSPGRCFRLL
jgi:transcriptional regulator with XRE-family HTH domain